MSMSMRRLKMMMMMMKKKIETRFEEISIFL